MSAVTALVLRTMINAVALWITVRLIPDIKLPAAQSFPAGDWWKLIVVALIFGLLNAYLKPILRALTWPIRLLTLGLFSLVINAAVLLLLAWVSDAFALGLRIGPFPPTLDSHALVAALLGSLVISVVSLILSEMLPDPTSWRTRLAL